MALSRSIIAIIGRIDPAIYDVVYPHGPAVGFRTRGIRSASELNPQPLPPLERYASDPLNPQPLPPGVEFGAYVGHELVRAAGLARVLGLTLQLTTDDICPPPRPFPWPFPWPWPGPWPGPWREGEWESDFESGYALGLGAVLEATAPTWERLEDSGLLEQVHGIASELAEKQFG